MWNGKKKALTFSFDDGVMQDRRLVEILKKYGLKGTFNLNSGMMYHECVWNTGGVDVIRLNHDECLELFGDFEPAVHTLTHPDLLSEGDYMRERQIAGDKANLERLFGRKIYGMAYPGGSGTSDELIELVSRFGIKYARLPYDIKYEDVTFDVPQDLFRLTGVKISNGKLSDIAEKFVKLDRPELSLLYIWGHSYEFDINGSWDRFEEICSMLSGRDDTFYGTNHECLQPFYK
ncbi:MAG: polysaccharide deacetylase family protein [Clostridia bacterium]|nr:polysaccharide deacetylase family protein [Clostridia bacterium]